MTKGCRWGLVGCMVMVGGIYVLLRCAVVGYCLAKLEAPLNLRICSNTATTPHFWPHVQTAGGA